MKKIIYIAMFPLTGYIKKYLYIQEMINAGYDIEYWDLKGIYFKGHHFVDVLSKEYIREISSFQELEAFLRSEDLTKTIFVLQVYFEWRVLSLCRLMTRFGCKTVYFPLVMHSRRGLATRIIDGLRPAIFLQSILNMIAKFFKKAGLIKNYDLVFVAGQLTRDAYKNCARVVNINYLDYDRYQLAKNKSELIVSGDYCVFLDEGCVYNEDVKILDLEQLDFGKFYGLLNHFFKDIEKMFNLKVVIAAHPGINYDRSLFDGREIYEGKTCDLVKDCQFVISQSSTSTSFAVFFKKPIIFVYTDEYIVKRKPNFRTLEFLSNELGARSYNMDLTKDVDFLESPSMNLDLYDKYKYRSFTSPESEGKFSKDIVIETFQRL